MEERRQHQRFTLPRGTFCILRYKLDALNNHSRMSIGEISMVLYKSKSELMAQVKNLGHGGMAFDGTLEEQLDLEKVELDLLMAEKGLYIHNIPYSTLYANDDSKGTRKSRQLRVNAVGFKDLDADLKRQLDEMLSHGNPA
jgi:hypothetical protein